ncbi:hypothetical protein LC087_08525 [Bacillus carboniphilus]|uniref:Uncharacterized protein n=1 Tax=Bacillus carboniphilus TaxID=86663 RepID=A0ABY9JZY0_9BACI|nr:hypothetical protein [Bacillus carboniphilus]WLR44117.1 hypothetical protein LC087_08525 [Bacillus carboniphilus]
MKKLIPIKEHIIIWLMVLGLSVTLIFTQYFADGLTKQFWLSFIPSIIIDGIFILIASYLISYLLKKNEKRKTKEKVYRMLGTRYEIMIMNFAKDYITYITKEPSEVSKGINNIQGIKSQVKSINSDLDNYVQADFFKKGIKVLLLDNRINTGNIFDNFREQVWSVPQYTNYFKQRHSKEIDAFINRYISVIPEELRERLFKVEDTLQSEVFTTGSEHGLPIDLSKATFNLKDLSKSIGELGQDIYLLLTYFEETQEDNTSKESNDVFLGKYLDDEKILLGLLCLMLSLISINILIL